MVWVPLRVLAVKDLDLLGADELTSMSINGSFPFSIVFKNWPRADTSHTNI
jgi:hypothetical protein